MKMEDHHICIHFLIFVHTASLGYLFLPLRPQRNLGQRPKIILEDPRDTQKVAMLRPRWSTPAHHGVSLFYKLTFLSVPGQQVYCDRTQIHLYTCSKSKCLNTMVCSKAVMPFTRQPTEETRRPISGLSPQRQGIISKIANKEAGQSKAW